MTFQELEALRRSLAGIRGRQVASLRQYHDDPSNGFYHRLDARVRGKFSKSSTATCVSSLVATGNWSAVARDRTAQLVQAMLDSEWSSAGLDENNPFTVAFILEAVTAVHDLVTDVFKKKKYLNKIKKADQILATSVKIGSAQIEPYGPSAYLTQLTTRALRASKKSRGLKVPNLNHVERWAWREIEHQLALLQANSASSDVYQLAYSIIIVTDLGDPARVTPDLALIQRTALAELFKRQLPDGSWPRSRPLFHYPDVGSAYCYEFEMMVQLLQAPKLVDELLDYLMNFGRAVARLLESAYPLGVDGMGWSSGHHPQFRGPESWSTASVFHFAHALDRLLAEAIRRSVFEHLDTPYIAPSTPRTDTSEFAVGFLDSPVYIGGVRSLRETLIRSFVDPVAKGARRVRLGRSLAPDTPMSAIFFGPPGTSKTELTKHIAQYLRWPRLVVDASYFVRNGMDRVQAEADQLFDMLVASEEVVVLLDEFDEMMRDRKGATEVLSRFLTTAMLPKLANINKERRIVFIVATNYIEDFDIAVSRRGRFDVILQIMPPTAAEKLRVWPEVLKNLKRLKVDQKKILPMFEDFTYDEFRGLAPRLASVTSADRMVKLVTQAHFVCTLSTPIDPQDKTNKTTWRQASEAQRSKNRVPFL